MQNHRNNICVCWLEKHDDHLHHLNPHVSQPPFKGGFCFLIDKFTMNRYLTSIVFVFRNIPEKKGKSNVLCAISRHQLHSFHTSSLVKKGSKPP